MIDESQASQRHYIHPPFPRICPRPPDTCHAALFRHATQNTPALHQPAFAQRPNPQPDAALCGPTLPQARQEKTAYKRRVPRRFRPVLPCHVFFPLRRLPFTSRARAAMPLLFHGPGRAASSPALQLQAPTKQSCSPRRMRRSRGRGTGGRNRGGNLGDGKASDGRVLRWNETKRMERGLRLDCRPADSRGMSNSRTVDHNSPFHAAHKAN